MADGAIRFLLDKLCDQITTLVNLEREAAQEFENLKIDLRRLEAYLMDAAEMPKKTFVFKANERHIRNVVYKVEDSIDIYKTKKAAAKSKRTLSRLGVKFSPNLEQRLRDLRQNAVAPVLNLLIPLRPENTNTNDGSIRSLERPGTQNTEAVHVTSAYNELPYHQKMCFLYTGLFPPGAEIKASTLTRLWVAENFVLPENGKSLEEIARAYLEHLIDKNLLTPVKKRFGRVKTCGVDAETREFCQKKATEEYLFTVIELPVHSDQDFYRLCFHSDPSRFLSKVGNSQDWVYVRSFLCLVTEHLKLAPDAISVIPSSFKPLRVLSCESTKFEEMPKITSLILLKHITLSIDDLDCLPRDISHLMNLQTLIIRTQSHFIQVKANIWKMVNLRHLKTKATFVMDKRREGYKGEAENLQTISRLAPESCSKLFEKAPNLKTLGIRGKLEGGLDASTLVKLSDLESLKLENFVRYGSARDNPVLALPPANVFPHKLKRLTLSGTFLIWNSHMRVLAAGIPNLEILKLKDNAFKGAFWRVAGDGFPNLRFLLIQNTDLFKWEASAAQFPKLERVVVRSCENRPKLPPSLEDNVVIIFLIDEVSENPGN